MKETIKDYIELHAYHSRVGLAQFFLFSEENIRGEFVPPLPVNIPELDYLESKRIAKLSKIKLKEFGPSNPEHIKRLSPFFNALIGPSALKDESLSDYEVSMKYLIDKYFRKEALHSQASLGLGVAGPLIGLIPRPYAREASRGILVANKFYKEKAPEPLDLEVVEAHPEFWITEGGKRLFFDNRKAFGNDAGAFLINLHAAQANEALKNPPQPLITKEEVLHELKSELQEAFTDLLSSGLSIDSNIQEIIKESFSTPNKKALMNPAASKYLKLNQHEREAISRECLKLMQSNPSVLYDIGDMKLVSDMLFDKMTTISADDFKNVDKIRQMDKELKLLKEDKKTPKAKIAEKAQELNIAIELEQAKRVEFDRKLITLGHGVQAMSLIASFAGDFRLAQQIETVGNAGLTITKAINELATGAALTPLGPVVAIGGAVLSLVGLFKKKKRDNSAQIILDSINKLSKQIEQLGQHIDLRFDRIEMNQQQMMNMLSEIYTAIGEGFTHIDKMLRNIYECMEYRFDHLETMLAGVYKDLIINFAKVHQDTRAIETLIKSTQAQLDKISEQVAAVYIQSYEDTKMAALSFLGDCHEETQECEFSQERFNAYYSSLLAGVVEGCKNINLAGGTSEMDNTSLAELGKRRTFDNNVNGLIATYKKRFKFSWNEQVVNPSFWHERVDNYLEFAYLSPQVTVEKLKADLPKLRESGDLFKRFVVALSKNEAFFDEVFKRYHDILASLQNKVRLQVIADIGATEANLEEKLRNILLGLDKYTETSNHSGLQVLSVPATLLSSAESKAKSLEAGICELGQAAHFAMEANYYDGVNVNDGRGTTQREWTRGYESQNPCNALISHYASEVQSTHCTTCNTVVQHWMFEGKRNIVLADKKVKELMKNVSSEIAAIKEEISKLNEKAAQSSTQANSYVRKALEDIAARYLKDENLLSVYLDKFLDESQRAALLHKLFNSNSMFRVNLEELDALKAILTSAIYFGLHNHYMTQSVEQHYLNTLLLSATQLQSMSQSNLNTSLYFILEEQKELLKGFEEIIRNRVIYNRLKDVSEITHFTMFDNTLENLKLIEGILLKKEGDLRLQKITPQIIYETFKENNQEQIRYLSNNRVDLNMVDESGNTALHLALKAQDKKTTLALLEKDVELNKPNNASETPLDIAVTMAPIKLRNDLLIALIKSGALATKKPEAIYEIVKGIARIARLIEIKELDEKALDRFREHHHLSLEEIVEVETDSGSFFSNLLKFPAANAKIVDRPSASMLEWASLLELGSEPQLTAISSLNMVSTLSKLEPGQEYAEDPHEGDHVSISSINPLARNQLDGQIALVGLAIYMMKNFYVWAKSKFSDAQEVSAIERDSWLEEATRSIAEMKTIQAELIATGLRLEAEWVERDIAAIQKNLELIHSYDKDLIQELFDQIRSESEEMLVSAREYKANANSAVYKFSRNNLFSSRGLQKASDIVSMKLAIEPEEGCFSGELSNAAFSAADRSDLGYCLPQQELQRQQLKSICPR